MSDILQQYKVTFTTPLKYPLFNRIESINDWLSLFMEDNFRVNGANALLNAVNQALSDGSQTVKFDTQSLLVAIINNSVTAIYEDLESYIYDNNIAPNFSLPTSDFQVIAQAWRDYLVQSPATPG